MSNKILMPQLVSLLSEAAGVSKKSSEAFLKAFFFTLSDILESHESVKIKNLGTFKITRVEPRKSVDVSTGSALEIPAHFKVVFSPAKSLAEKVNGEFAWLDIVEIAEAVSAEELDAAGAVPPPLEISSPPAFIPTASESGEQLGEELEKEFGEIEPVEPFGPLDPDDPEPNIPIPDNIFNIMNTENQNSTNNDQFSNSYPEGYASKAEVLHITKNVKKMRTSIDDIETYVRRRSRMNLILTIIICAALMTGGFFIMYGVMSSRLDEKEKAVAVQEEEDALDLVREEEEVAASEEISLQTSDSTTGDAASSELEAVLAAQGDAPTQPSDIKAMDKITNTRYLTTMAKEHYGNYNLWPYIYLENQKKLGHPDRIKPGTEIVIPNIQKYGVDPNNPKDIEKAKRLGIEIYSKYK